MFLIFGIDQREKELSFQQLADCPRCGRYSAISVILRYSCFTLFFLPLFRFQRRYFARMRCCGAVCEIDPALGRTIERGEPVCLREEDLRFGGAGRPVRRCAGCGFETEEEFRFCPKCGRQL